MQLAAPICSQRQGLGGAARERGCLCRLPGAPGVRQVRSHGRRAIREGARGELCGRERLRDQARGGGRSTMQDPGLVPPQPSPRYCAADVPLSLEPRLLHHPGAQCHVRVPVRPRLRAPGHRTDIPRGVALAGRRPCHRVVPERGLPPDTASVHRARLGEGRLAGIWGGARQSAPEHLLLHIPSPNAPARDGHGGDLWQGWVHRHRQGGA
mmetsp:Transcript_18304/g.53352  ORF Transcript_18304/g.53352 Transcript_18304/m.53352 type:complete len:210 (-) Transcript_18304:1481-2110(-)